MTTAIIPQEERVTICAAFTKTFGKNALDGKRFRFARELASDDGTQHQAWFRVDVYEYVYQDFMKKKRYRAPKFEELKECAQKLLDRIKKNVPAGWVAVVRGWEADTEDPYVSDGDWYIVLVKVLTPTPVAA